MKRWIKKIGICLLIILAAIQFIRPALNKTNEKLPGDIINLYDIPDTVLHILQRSCYDCHSNNTQYPWYSEIQPLGLWLNRHIKRGKGYLNFSDFGSYKGKRQINKLKAIQNSIKDGTMPLKSYTLMHSNARLTDNDKQIIIDWVDSIRSALK